MKKYYEILDMQMIFEKSQSKFLHTAAYFHQIFITIDKNNMRISEFEQRGFQPAAK